MSHERIETILKVLVGIVAVVTVGVGIYEYKTTNERNFYFAYWSKKIDTYATLCREAAAVAADQNDQSSVKEFFTAYRGLIIRDDPEVIHKAQEIFESIRGWKQGQQFPADALERKSIELAEACALGIRKSWDAHFGGNAPPVASK
jgi:hypothetical protein